MAKAWFPFYLNDYLADTVLLDLAEHGAFVLLMSYYWNEDANASANASSLHKVCRCTTDAERDAVDSVVAKYFSVVDGKLHNGRMHKEWLKAQDIRVKRQKAANKMHQKKDANAAASADAPEMQKHTQSQSQSHSNNKDKSEKADEPKHNEQDMQCAEWISNLITALDPKRKKPNLSKWADTIRLMREKDGLSHREIAEVFKWANSDSFWQSNILSVTKLREKFSDLKIKMQKNGKANTGKATRSQQLEEVFGDGTSGVAAKTIEAEFKIIDDAAVGFLTKD